MRTSKAKYFNITMNDRRSRHIRPVSPTSSCFGPGYATGEVKVSPQTSNEEWNKDKTRIAAPDVSRRSLSSIRVWTRGLLKDRLQIVHFHQSIARSVVHTPYDRGVVSRRQHSNDGRLAWLSRSMPTVLDRANLVGGDDPADYRSLPVVIRGNQRPCTV